MDVDTKVPRKQLSSALIKDEASFATNEGSTLTTQGSARFALPLVSRSSSHRYLQVRHEPQCYDLSPQDVSGKAFHH